MAVQQIVARRYARFCRLCECEWVVKNHELTRGCNLNKIASAIMDDHDWCMNHVQTAAFADNHHRITCET